jgi:hypothetical protein
MPVRSNPFGDVRAELDHSMLNRSFYEWQDYRALFETNDRFIVVGRRGTGKSALTYQLRKVWSERKYISIVIAPNEEQVIGLRPVAGLFGTTVSKIRAGVKIAWRYAMFMEIALALHEHYKTKRDVEQRAVLVKHVRAWEAAGGNCIDRTRNALKASLKEISDPEDRIAELSGVLQLNRVAEEVTQILEDGNRQVVILIDRLDEGYEPDQIGVGLVDGIVYGIDELKSALEAKLRALVFLRDNIFRAMEEEDKDFSRNLEAHYLRLHWDPQELMNMAIKRIREVFPATKEADSDIKVWNSITANELHGRDQFKRILRLTLYRPRDLIALLNEAFYEAQRQDRSTLIEADFNTSARKISQSRYDDLSKEYESVIPGVRLLADSFVGSEAKFKWKDAATRLASVLKLEDQASKIVQQFKIFATPDEAIKALYGVGFFGMFDKQSSKFVFSHDGKKSDRAFNEDDVLMIHPCYWSALNLQHDVLEQSDAEQIFDEYEITIASASAETRSLLLGRLISELHQIPKGDDGADQFEGWCKRAIEIAFARQLTNVALKPNKQAPQRRDIVATNQGEEGVWKRILQDYGTRLVIFEVKNYDVLGVGEYRQVHSYLDREYGKCGFIICRDSMQAIPKGGTLDAFREFYMKGYVIVKISATTLITLLSKLRSPWKVDAGSNMLSSILDDHVLLYASGQTNADGSQAKKRRRRRKR